MLVSARDLGVPGAAQALCDATARVCGAAHARPLPATVPGSCQRAGAVAVASQDARVAGGNAGKALHELSETCTAPAWRLGHAECQPISDDHRPIRIN